MMLASVWIDTTTSLILQCNQQLPGCREGHRLAEFKRTVVRDDHPARIAILHLNRLLMKMIIVSMEDVVFNTVLCHRRRWQDNSLWPLINGHNDLNPLPRTKPPGDGPTLF